MATGDSTRPGPGPGDEPLTLPELLDDDTGRWQITTQTSIYLLDLDHRTMTRFPGAAGDQGIDPGTRGVYPVNLFEGDGSPHYLWRLVQCRVGERMSLVAPYAAMRSTTPVREIRLLAPGTPP